MLGMGNMRQWLMNISLVGGWFPAAAFAVVGARREHEAGGRRVQAVEQA